MAPPIDPERVRSLAVRLVACPSVSPDVAGETACANVIRAALPPGLESGTWTTADGRPVVWARLGSGRSPAVVLLAHYDTVGGEEFGALGGTDEVGLAFQPEALGRRLLELAPGSLPAGVVADLEEERRVPGTWMFGRGALDMKCGVAAGLAALEALAAAAATAPLPGTVLFAACPDEENQSAGMLRAVQEMAALREREGLGFAGAISLDYGEGPFAYEGVAGKLLVRLWVLGAPSHVGDPFGGVDASQLAAAIVSRVTSGPALVERGPGGRGVPPVALRLRDLKPRYDVQTALEAEIELNLITFERPLAATLEVLRKEIAAAMAERARAMRSLGEWTGHGRRPDDRAAAVLTYPELRARAGRGSEPDPLSGAAPDARAATRERVRVLAREAGLIGPAVVITLLPPYYPHAAPRAGGFAAALRPVLARHGVELRPWYPFITDASYVAWRADAPAEVEAHLPALGHEYRLPVAASRALDLEVVTIGPWGRDAHGLYERVHAPYAFGILPRLIVEAVEETLRSAHRAAKEKT